MVLYISYNISIRGVQIQCLQRLGVYIEEEKASTAGGKHK